MGFIELGILNLMAHPSIPQHPLFFTLFSETNLERCAWDCSPESSHQLTDDLRANAINVSDVNALGRPVMLAEAIIFDRCLGTTPAAAVVERVGPCWRGTRRNGGSGSREAILQA